jgi:hypothetical protein
MRYICIFAFVFLNTPVTADQIMFSNGTTQVVGTVSLDARGYFAIKGKIYAPDQVLQWFSDHPATIGPAHEVRFRDGRLYLGQLLSVDPDSITLRVEPLGESIAIPRKQIQEIVFFRRADKHLPQDFPKAMDTGILIRKGAPPVPCQLDQIRGGTMVFSTQLKRTSLPVESLLSYVIHRGIENFEHPSGQMEIGLTDGSIFHGKVSEANGKMMIQTADFRVFSVPSNAIRFVRSHALGEWLPLWKSGKAIQDGLGQAKELCSCSLLLSVGESVRVPARSDGALHLHAKRSSGSSAKLVVSRNGKELTSIELKANWIKKVFPIGEGTEISFRIESPELGATAMIGDLVILKNGQG